MQLKHNITIAPFDRRRRKHPAAVAKSDPHVENDDGLLRTAGPIMMAAYAVAFLIVTATFWQSGDTVLSIGVCVVYLAMFFGIPFTMARIRKSHDERWRPNSPDSRSNRITVFTGTLTRNEALLQITLVPFVVVFAFASFAIIWISVTH